MANEEQHGERLARVEERMNNVEKRQDRYEEKVDEQTKQIYKAIGVGVAITTVATLIIEAAIAWIRH